MRSGQVIGATTLASIVIGLGLVPAEVGARPPRTLGLSGFGRVFREAGGALLRVRTADPRRPFATGFLVGAHGEFVFGASATPPAELQVQLGDGAERQATLIGFEPALLLGVGRLRDPLIAAPLQPAATPALVREQWVLVLQHDASGAAEPHAGLVERSARSAELGGKPSKERFVIAPIWAPGAGGSPVLSPRGELLGVVFEGGARRSRAVQLDSLLPFLRASILDR